MSDLKLSDLSNPPCRLLHALSVSRTEWRMKLSIMGNRTYMLVAILLFFVNGNAQQQDKPQPYKVSASSLNVRSGPKEQSRKIGQLDKGDTVVVYWFSEDSCWARVRQESCDGWVSMKYLEPIEFVETNSNNLSEYLNRYGITKDVVIVVGLLLLLVVWMIIHMSCVLAKERNTIVPINVEEMKVQRPDQNLSETMTQDEIIECLCLIEEDKALWTKIKQGGISESVITKKKQMRHAEDTIKQLQAKMPTDDNLVQTINEYVRDVSYYKKRVFDCIIAIPIVYLIMSVLASVFIHIAVGPIMLAIAIPYVLSCFAPTYLVGKKALKGNRKYLILGGVIATLVAMNLGAQTIRTTTYWSDGTKTIEDDHSQSFMSLLITLAVLLSIPLYAVLYGVFVKYFRNYVFYV